uniref:hypothetical protein n=1 Tax=Burkholderia diffusa TaxID=488732 RepID=UPI001CC68F88|nr:hypothetical protein [Burkholderia diffusa]
MPVDLSALPPEARPDARPPRLIVWLFLGVIVIGGGVALILWRWPLGKSTHDWRFWVWFAVPPLVYGLMLAARWHIYEQALGQAEAYNRQRKGVVDHNTKYGQRPLALLAHAYATAMGERDVARRIMENESTLAFLPVRGIGASVSHTSIISQRPEARETEKRRTRRDALPLTDDDLLELFGCLISQLQPKLRALPAHLVLPVQLAVTGNEYVLSTEEQWDAAWHAFGLGEYVLRRPTEPGLMALDTWLDETDPHRRDRVALYVNVQLRDDPPENGAEAATAVLVAWPGMAERLGLPVEAWMHRPVRSSPEKFAIALEDALSWGCVASVDDTQAWVSGLDSAGRECFSHALRQSPAASSSLVEDVVVTGNVDSALGDAGHAAGWLACALATERLDTHDQPQLIATQDSAGVVYAVIRKPCQATTELQHHS